MANTRFQHKRSSVSGVVPTTSDIATGELGINLADRKLFTSNGTAVFELGSNLSSLTVSGNVAITGVANVTGNVTIGASAFFVGNGNFITTVNATNITTGTLPNARLDANVTNTSANFTITGIRTHQANIVVGNTTVNTQHSNATILISNATSTTTLGLTDLRIGNTATNVVIANTTSSFGGNVTIAGVANVTGNVTVGASAFFVGNGVNITTVNATNITTGTLPNARLAAEVVNTSGAFTITGIYTHSANVVMGNTTVNTQHSNATILISNSTSTTTLGLADLRIGNTASNVIISNTVSSFPANLHVGNTTVNTRISGTSLILANATFSTTVGFGTSSFGGNIHTGNTTVNTQFSNATILISNATSTTTLGLADLRIGSTATNVVIANTTSSFGGNVVITGTANVAANLTIGASGELIISNGAGIQANGTFGTAGQVLSSNSTGVYWATPASAAGGELFNINVTNATGYAVTTTMAAAFTAPATAGIEYVVHSIQITNIGTANAAISGEFSGTTYANTSFALTVPVPRESAVELLKMPKVLQPSDIIRLQADVVSTLHAYITIESITSTAYFGAGVDITADATFTDLHTATGNSVITSVLLSNDDGVNDVKARVVWTDGANTIQGYLCFDMIIPADSTVELLEKVKFLPSGHKIRVYANVGGRLEAIIAGKLL